MAVSSVRYCASYFFSLVPCFFQLDVLVTLMMSESCLTIPSIRNISTSKKQFAVDLFQSSFLQVAY